MGDVILTKGQLYQIAVNENIDLSTRYEAARRLHEFNISRVNLRQVKELYHFYDNIEIAEIMNVHYQVINGVVSKYRLWDVG